MIHPIVHPHCDIGRMLPGCDGPEDVIIDGRTINGPWANMCVGHHKAVGVGLGTGRGQKWRIDPESGRKIEKLEG